MRALGDLVLEARSGFATGARAEDGVAQVRMNNITAEGSWDWSRVVRVPAESIAIERYLLKPGDVLFNNTNSQELIGKTALFTGYVDPITFSNHFTRLRPGPYLDSGYLALWLHRQWQSGYFYRASTRWVGQAALGMAQLLSLEIPLPEIAVQRRIAFHVVEQRSVADRALAASTERQVAIRDLRGRAVSQAFADLSEYPRFTLGGLGELTDGDWILTNDYAPSGVRLFQVADIGRGKLLAKSNRFISMDRANELHCTFLRPGDILISRMPDPIGRACELPMLPYPSITAVDVTIFRPDRTRLNIDYVVQFMNSRSWLTDVASKASGATRQRISRANMELLQVPVPPLHAQQRIAITIQERLEAINSVESATEMERDATAGLSAAILRHAFANPT